MLITERIFTNDFHPVSIVFYRCLFGMILEEKVNGVYEKKFNEVGSE
ncbi:hypothetical protein [Peribacillus frigoritolerans]|nr:hypothetical protein [Peribacillus frigoritolerans]